MRRFRPISRLTALLAILTGLAGTARAQILVPDGFVHESYIPPPFDGQPLGLTWLPDHRVLVIEKNGGIRIAPAGGGESTNIHTIPDVDQTLERGLLGVAVDPGWPVRPYLYFYYTHNAGTNRIVMLTASGDLTDSTSTNVTLSNPFDLLHIPDTTPSHNGGALEFGSDGMLYASCGDDAELRCDAQDLGSLLGKIYRLDVSSMPGAGTGPPPKADITPVDNPFPGPDENEKLVYVWGLRNPYRFLFDRVTGDMFIGDVGGTQFEEVDLVPFLSGGGQNFGWPVNEGFGLPENPDTCGMSNLLTDPIYDYPHSGNPAAIMGGPLYRHVPGSDTSLPASYDGMYFYLEFNLGYIRRLEDTGGSVWTVAPDVPGQPEPGNWATGFGFTQADFRDGPDGALYMAQLTTNAAGPRGIYRIRRDEPTDVTPTAPPPSLSIVAAPNPASFETGVDLRWTVTRGGRATIRVYDVTGRAVRTLFDRELPASDGTVHWDARTDTGRAVSAGTYVFSLETASGERATGKVLLLR